MLNGFSSPRDPCKPLIRPGGSVSALSGQPPTAFHECVAFQLFLTRSEYAPLLSSSHQPLPYSLLNYPEKTMNGEALVGLALIKAFIGVAVFSHLSY